MTHSVGVDARLHDEGAEEPVGQIVLDLLLDVIAQGVYNLGIFVREETDLALLGVLGALGRVVLGHDPLGVRAFFSQFVHLFDVLGDLFLLRLCGLRDVAVGDYVRVIFQIVRVELGRVRRQHTRHDATPGEPIHHNELILLELLLHAKDLLLNKVQKFTLVAEVREHRLVYVLLGHIKFKNNFKNLKVRDGPDIF